MEHSSPMAHEIRNSQTRALRKIHR